MARAAFGARQKSDGFFLTFAGSNSRSSAQKESEKAIMTNHKTGCGCKACKKKCGDCGSKGCKGCGPCGGGSSGHSHGGGSSSSSSSSSSSNRGCEICNTCGCDDDDDCPNLEKLCPEDKLRFERINVFSESLTTGAPQQVVLDCTGCLSDEQMAAIALESGLETIFIQSTEAVDGAFPVRAFVPTPEDFSGTGALVAASFIRDKLLCDKSDVVTLDFVDGAGPTEVTFDEDIPSFTLGPAVFGDTFPVDVPGPGADLLACLGLVEGDLTGDPIQVVSTGALAAVILPIANKAAFDLIDPVASAACLEAVAAVMLPDLPPLFAAFTTDTEDPEIDVLIRTFFPGVEPTVTSGDADIAAYLLENEVFDAATLDAGITAAQGVSIVDLGATGSGADIFATVGGPTFVAAQGTINFNCDTELSSTEPEPVAASRRTGSRRASTRTGGARRRRGGR